MLPLKSGHHEVDRLANPAYVSMGKNSGTSLT